MNDQRRSWVAKTQAQCPVAQLVSNGTLAAHSVCDCALLLGSRRTSGKPKHKKKTSLNQTD